MGVTGGMGRNIVGAVMQGEGGGMTSYRRIAIATDVNNLAADLHTIGTAREPKFKNWWVAPLTK